MRDSAAVYTGPRLPRGRRRCADTALVAWRTGGHPDRWARAGLSGAVAAVFPFRPPASR